MTREEKCPRAVSMEKLACCKFTARLTEYRIPCVREEPGFFYPHKDPTFPSGIVLFLCGKRWLCSTDVAACGFLSGAAQTIKQTN